MDGVLDVTGLVIGGDEIWVQTAVDQDCVTASVPVNEISLVTLFYIIRVFVIRVIGWFARIYLNAGTSLETDGE